MTSDSCVCTNIVAGLEVGVLWRRIRGRQCWRLHEGGCICHVQGLSKSFTRKLYQILLPKSRGYRHDRPAHIAMIPALA